MKVRAATMTAAYTWTVKGLLLIVPFLSLYISRSMFFPFITGRNFAFRILVEIAFALWIGLILFSREHRPSMSRIAIAVLIFGAVVGAATLTSIDPFYSFWSRYERMDGYFMTLHLIAYFFMLATVFRTKRDWHAFWGIFVGVGVIIGFFGILQKLGLRPSLQGGARIDGTIGNPTYLAAYLLLLSFVVLSLFLAAKKRWLRYALGLVFVYFIFIIFLTATRGAILALVLSAFLVPLLYLFFVRGDDARVRRKRKGAAIALVAFVLIPVIFWLVRDTALVQKNYIFKRFADLSLHEKTTRSRFMIWNISWQGVKERPVLGWGQENFTNVFAKHYNPKLFDQEPWFDRSHNIVFDWLVNAGFLGLVAFIGLFVAAGFTIRRLLKDRKIDPRAGIVLISCGVAYFFQNLFVFDNFNTYIVFFGLLAYLHALPEFEAHERGTVRSEPSVQDGQAVIALGATALALIAAGFLMYYGNVKPIRQSLALIDILESIGSKNPDAVKGLFDKALSFNTFGSRETIEQYLRLAIDLVASGQIPPDAKKQFVGGALEAGELHLKRFPNDVRVRISLALLYTRAFILDSSYLAKGREHLDEMLRRSPNRQQTIFSSVENYLIAGNIGKALEELTRAVALEPLFLDAHVNRAIVAVNGGQEAIVTEEIAAIEKLAPKNAEPFVRLAGVYLKTQNVRRTRELYEIAVGINPENPEYHANLAALYLEEGRTADAIREANRAAEIDPANYKQRAEDFLKQIQKR